MIYASLLKKGFNMCAHIGTYIHTYINYLYLTWAHDPKSIKSFQKYANLKGFSK